jgi:hypothetical protein
MHMPMKLLVSLLLAMPLALSNQGPGGLTFTATLDAIKINGRAGQVVTRQFRLTLDPNQQRTHFKARVEDWWRSEDSKQSFYAEPGTLKRSCAPWVSLNPMESAIDAGGTLVVRLSVAIPVEPRPGGYWCALTVDQVPDPLSDTPGVGIRFLASVSTGIFVYLDPIERDARIVDLQVIDNEALIKVHNGSNTPIAIEGHVEFRAAGTETATASVDVPRRTILTEPTADGTLSVPLPPAANLPSGRYLVRAVLDFGADHDIGAEREVEIRRASVQNAPTR